MKKISTLILFFAVMATSAHAKSSVSDSLHLQNTHTEYSKNQIDISLSYPQLVYTESVKDSTKSLAHSINNDVCRMIASIAPATEIAKKDSLWIGATSPKLLEIYLLGAAQGMSDEMAGYGGPIAYQLYSEWTAFSNAQIVSIFIKTYLFTGGAHGMTIGRILNYDTQNGQPIDLVTQIADTASLMDLAELYFCKERRLPKGAIKLNTGLFYELADLPFPDQIGFTSKGMILYYDPYSIAPYSFGAVSITIPFKELDDILSENFYKMKVTAGGSKTYNQKTKVKK